MAKIIAFDMITLDGYFAGPQGEIDWHNVDEEFNEFAIRQLDKFGTLLFGRVTYEFMAGYWPTSAALQDDPVVAGKMNTIPKIVFSKTLEKADWKNTSLVKGDLGQEVRRLQQQAGKDAAIFGSGKLTNALANLGLVDEYRLMVNPVALGQGIPLFQGLHDPLRLKLISSRNFQNGNVLLVYGL